MAKDGDGEKKEDGTKTTRAMGPTGFYAMAFGQLLKEDGLAILAPGLGLTYFLSKFIQLYCRPTNLVLVLNANGKTYRDVTECLQEEGVREDLMPGMLSSDVDAASRQIMYDAGGCYFVTNRLLVVDLLTERLDPKHVSGILVHNGHKATRTSILGLILRLYRQGNRTGFIKSFSNAPSALTSGFNKCEEVLKVLLVPRIYLWPRFHVDVKESLASVRCEPIIEEMTIPCSYLMKQIEAGLTKSMENCLKELSRSSSILAGEDTSVSEALSHSFDRRISRLLAGSTSTKATTRYLLEDIRTLRRLSQQVLKIDAVSFYAALRGVQKAATPRFGRRHVPTWLVADAADSLFRAAKERVYRLTKNSYGTRSVNLVLETNPKWTLLRRAVKDVGDLERDRIRSRRRDRGQSLEDDVMLPTTVLVFAYDESTVRQLRSILTSGGERALLRRQLARFIRRNYPTASSSSVAMRKSGRNATGTSFGDLLRNAAQREDTENLQAWIERGKRADISSAFPQWEENVRFVWRQSASENWRALDELRKTHVAFLSEANLESDNSSKDRGFSFFSDLLEHCALNNVDRRNVREREEDNERVVVDLREDMDATSDGDTITGGEESSRNVPAEDPEDAWLLSASQPTGDNRSDETMSSSTPLRPTRSTPALNVMLQSTQGRTDIAQMLKEVQPSYVILYDPTPSLVREVEVYNAFRSLHASVEDGDGDGVRVFFLMYEDSTEEQRYLNALRHETKAFKQLVEEMAHMVIPPSALFPKSLIRVREEAEATRSMTRIGGRRRQKKEVPRVIVDLREFRSGLPAILHSDGIRLQPATLDVGDYVLSPTVCVERKSIPDLYGSFQSGRLFTQAESMARHYDLSALLIEFDPERAFLLTTTQDLSTNIEASSIVSRFVLLTRHFPKLRLLWSRSQHMTAKIFHMLKHNRAEPVVDKATSYKQNEASRHDGSSTDDKENLVDLSARDFLMRLPGVRSEANVRVLRRHVRNLSALSEMSVLDLTPLIGSDNARKLHGFLHRTLK